MNTDFIVDNTNCKKIYIDKIEQSLIPTLFWQIHIERFDIPLWKAYYRNIKRWIFTGKYIPVEVLKNMKKNYGNIYFTSDTHFSHRNIVRGTSNWKTFEEGSNHQSLRNFDTLEEHNEALIKNFNSLVKENDTLYHLGDWSFGGHEQIKIFRDRLKCKNIHLIFGNHDQHITPINSPYRKLFASCQHYLELSFKLDRKWNQFKKTNIVLSHYAMRVWNKSHHGAIHLFGHSHGSLPDIGNRSMDVGVDTHNLYPYHFDEILYYLLDRSISFVDHHNQNTN